MVLDPAICERASRSRDARFDGRFFIGVRTTGIYCRPICPARPAAPHNVLYFPSAAAAAEAGFRPCLRCRPESAPGSPAWNGVTTTVARSLRLVAEGALLDRSVDDLAASLGVTSRHLRRVFATHLGASPRSIAGTQRLHFAKKLLDETRMPMTAVATAAGYGSVRRFNAAFRDAYGRAPSALRGETIRHPERPAGEWTLRLGYRPPLDWPAVLAFLGARATPGVEWVRGGTYGRVFEFEGRPGAFEVRPVERSASLALSVRYDDPAALFRIVARVRAMFDLDADVHEIGTHLRSEPLLAACVRRAPGLRVPGAWDPFELTVRAILGQQVSVRGATTLAGRLVEAYGAPVAAKPGAPARRLFPRPQALLRIDPSRVGVPRKRAEAIEHLARAVADGVLRFDGTTTPEEVEHALVGLPGIGRWTAAYVAMRGLRDPDAFPASDLVLRAAIGDTGRPANEREASRRAERWRPWRAYAAMHLWHGRTVE